MPRRRRPCGAEGLTVLFPRRFAAPARTRLQRWTGRALASGLTVFRHGALLALLLTGPPSAFAHPVAQGSLDAEVSSGKLFVRARVSTEEAFLANAFGPDARAADSGATLWDRHGQYLLEHLRILADGRRLAGRLVAVVPPASGTASDPGSSAGRDRIVYDLEYDLADEQGGAHPSRDLQFQQDLLNEFEFAPGNRWEATFVVRIAEPGGPAIEGLLLTSREPLVYRCAGEAGAREAGSSAARLDRLRLFRDYLRHGVAHILTGYDHLLFICALVLATKTLWDLIKIVSAFTLAHTITLTLAVLDVVRLPGKIVEPMIAASIVFVALENVLRPERSRGMGRLLVAFFFGLFHGLGFAGGLLEAMQGMTGLTVGLAILAFSAGVELGHQMVVLPLFGLLRLSGWAKGDEEARSRVHARTLKYGSALISGAGVVYLIAALR